MSNNEKSELSVLPARKVATKLAVSVEATTDDVLAIAVASHEDLLEQQRATLMKRMKQLEKMRDDLETEMDAAAKAQAEAFCKQRLEALVAGLESFGFTNATCDITTVVLHADTRKVTMVCKLMAQTLERSYYRGKDQDELFAKKEVDASEDIINKMAEHKKVIEELAQLSDLYTEVRRALANIDRVERRARAALARRTLEATDEGRALLATMQNVDSPFYGLLMLSEPKTVQAESAGA